MKTSCKILKKMFVDELYHDFQKSMMYQKKDIDFSMVTPLLTSTIESLVEIRDLRNGQILNSFLKAVPSEPSKDSGGLVTFEFLGHTIRDGNKQRSESVTICDKFITDVISMINKQPNMRVPVFPKVFLI